MLERTSLFRYWRLAGTGISFSVFGLGGLLFSCVLFPLIHVLTKDRRQAQRRCRYAVHLGFRAFLQLMTGMGVIEWRVRHEERLTATRGQLIVPNHPSLIDVILTIAQIRDAYCVVKSTHWYNPFLFGVMRATGYVSNADGTDIITSCTDLLRRGETLILFPEGTRSVPDRPLKLQRGAVAVALTAGVEVTPVIIRVSPPTLQKGRPWYDVPLTRPRFELDVHAPIVLLSADDGAARFSTRARRATRELSGYYEKQLQWKIGVQCEQPY